MWKPIARCGIIGGVIVFLWLMLTWMVLPFHKSAVNHFMEEPEVISCITRYAPKDGIYVIPSPQTREEDRAKGIMIFANVRRGVKFGNVTKSMAFEAIIQIIAACFITYLLLQTKAMKYWRRVWFVTIIGGLVALLGLAPSWIWWCFPSSWVAVEMFDLVVGWFIGGMVIAKLIKN